MAPPPSPRRVNIPPLHELRFELEKGEACSIKLVNGSAEIFGFDLLPYIEHPLEDEVRAAVFSWTGAEVEMSRLSLLCSLLAWARSRVSLGHVPTFVYEFAQRSLCDAQDRAS